MHPKIIELSKKLEGLFLSTPANEISIFLCGGSSAGEKALRKQVGDKIRGTVSKYKYSVYYPEDMFIELILGHQRQDLLSLENLLADSVNAVVILLQSAGTFAELGAFTNYPKLRDKLIIVIDPRYRLSKSFINYGPVRYLRTKTKSKIIFQSMDNNDLEKLVKEITDAARTISKHSQPIQNLTNPIASYQFYLGLIYIFDPMPKDAILTISLQLANDKHDTVVTAAQTVINSLINERKISFGSGNYSITDKGINNLINENMTKKMAREISSHLTEFRLEALNISLRRNYNRIWGEAEGS